jgi:hypothetical protein
MVKSVRQSVGQLKYEIILVAGACSEATHDWIRAQPDCVLIVQKQLLGGIIAYNAGAKVARYPYVQILNDDITVDGDSLARAVAFLEAHPEVGQVAFGHKYQKRGGDPQKPRVSGAFGYLYGQCCMTRRCLGDLAGWWGDLGMKHYAGDACLGMWIWQLGYRVVRLPGCTVTDYEHDDAVRQKWSDAPRLARNGPGKGHPDTDIFMQYWKGRLPKPKQWVPARVNRILSKAARGNLRTLMFKAMMDSGGRYPPRTALMSALTQYGPGKQCNQNWAMREAKGNKTPRAQQWFVKTARAFHPDLIFLQAQRPNNILPDTVKLLRRVAPDAYIINWDGDTHYPMIPFHAEIARVCDLQLTISPDLFPWYLSRGVRDIGYWPIAVEQQFLDVDRNDYFSESNSLDVLFLGSLYGEGVFPEAENRGKAVKILHSDPGIKCRVFGGGWHKVGIPTSTTLEDFRGNSIRYSQSKMGLSISQTAELWGYSSDRLYNIAATGCPVLLQKFKGMEEHGFVDGETCISWGNFREMLEKTRYYKAHPAEREAIGAAGKDLILRRHTWKLRVEELFSLIAGIGEYDE